MGPHNGAPRPPSAEAGVSIQDSSSDFLIRPVGCEKQEVRLIFVRAGSTEASPLHIVQVKAVKLTNERSSLYSTDSCAIDFAGSARLGAE